MDHCFFITTVESFIATMKNENGKRTVVYRNSPVEVSFHFSSCFDIIIVSFQSGIGTSTDYYQVQYCTGTVHTVSDKPFVTPRSYSQYRYSKSVLYVAVRYDTWMETTKKLVTIVRTLQYSVRYSCVLLH